GLLAGYVARGERAPRPIVVPPAAPAPTRCYASIVSDPLGATIVWAGSPLGTTPALNVTVPCGKAVGTLEQPGHAPFEERLLATPETPTSLFEHLAVSTCRVALESTPPGVAVALDGKFAGKTPLELDLPPHEVTVEAWMKGFHRWQKSVPVKGPRVD